MSEAHRIELPSGHVALIDAADAPLVAGYRWQVEKRKHTNYAVALSGSRTARTKTYLHRLIMQAKPGELIDHRNHNGLDDQRDNLRRLTTSANAANVPKRRAGSSQYKGVGWDARRACWRARITVNYCTIFLGEFAEEIDAAKAYDRAAVEHFAGAASLNFPARERGLEERQS